MTAKEKPENQKTQNKDRDYFQMKWSVLLDDDKRTCPDLQPACLGSIFKPAPATPGLPVPVLSSHVVLTLCPSFQITIPALPPSRPLNHRPKGTLSSPC